MMNPDRLLQISERLQGYEARTQLYNFVPRGARVSLYTSPGAAPLAYHMATVLSTRQRVVVGTYQLSPEMHRKRFFGELPNVDRVLVVYESETNGPFPLPRALHITNETARRKNIRPESVGVIVLDKEFNIVPLPQAQDIYPYSRAKRA